GFVDTLVREVNELGVKVLLNTEATPEIIAEHKPDATVIAVGSAPYVPEIAGVERARVFNPIEILDNPEGIGNRVLVVGGLNDHLPPVLAALYLADQGKEVTLLSENMSVGMGLEWSILHFLTK